VPPGGETCSQLLPPLVVDVLTENAALALLEVETATLMPAGAAAPVK
jgi:hypothetical protein